MADHASSTLLGEREGRQSMHSRGLATSFGFRRRPTSAIPIPTDNVIGERRRPTSADGPFDSNGNGTGSGHVGTSAPTSTSTSSNTGAVATTVVSRNSQRLQPPKKELTATRLNRFGFRQQSHSSIRNKCDTPTNTTITTTTTTTEHKNNNVERPRSKGGGLHITPNTIISPTSITTTNNNNNNNNNINNYSNKIDLKVKCPSTGSTTISTTTSTTTTSNSNTSTITYSANGDSTINTTTTSTISTSSTSIITTNNNNNSNKNRRWPSSIPQAAAAKLTMHSSQLPRPQPPALRVNLVESKSAKTVANLSRKVAAAAAAAAATATAATVVVVDECLPSSKEGSVTEEDSGIGSAHHRPYCCDMDNPHGSPTFTRRPSDDLDDGLVSEVAVIPLPRLPSVFDTDGPPVGGRRRRRRRKFSATSSEGFSDDDDDDEEKSVRDRSSTEKVRTHIVNSNCNSNCNSGTIHNSRATLDEQPAEWAQGGEAMIEEYNLQLSSSDEGKDSLDTTGLCINISKRRDSDDDDVDVVRSVLLTIEDPKFAAVASAPGNLLDDETSPIDSLISSCTESDELASTCNKQCSTNIVIDTNPSTPANILQVKMEKRSISISASPTSPGTPTNTSLSLSEGRDFLIDDEIADQPALTFNGDRYRSHTSATVTVTVNTGDSDSAPTTTLAPPNLIGTSTTSGDHDNDGDGATINVNTPCGNVSGNGDGNGDGDDDGNNSPGPGSTLLRRTNSVDTLSPCESIASDDLMLDFEHSVSSGLDDSAADRTQAALHSLDPITLRSELEHQDVHVAQHWSALLGSVTTHSVCRSGGGRSRGTTPVSSAPDSPRALSSRQSHSPLVTRAARCSPATYDSDDSVRLDRPTVNDLVAIKTMLLKLKRVLQEAGPAPLDPFRNGYCCEEGVSCDGQGAEVADLRRQIEFLQSELEDKERTLRQLQNQMNRYCDPVLYSERERDREHLDKCNAATQTERIRPVSAGPALLHHLPADGAALGPLVSVNDSVRRLARPSSMVETGARPSVPIPAPASAPPPPPPPPPLKLWRKPGEPAPPPARYLIMMGAGASLPRRARSRSRALPHHL